MTKNEPNNTKEIASTAVVILNYNNYADTINCIDSLLKYNTAEVKFFVVDNGSPDSSCVSVLDGYFSETFVDSYFRIKDGEYSELSAFPKMTFIISDVNDGYARGNNKALKYIQNDTSIDYILILNNDILFVQDIIPGLISGLDTLSNAAIVSPLLLKRDGKSIDYNCARKNATITDIILSNLGLAFHIHLRKSNQYILKNDPSLLKTTAVEIELPSGSCMLLKRDFFFMIGCFDPNTFLYYEENILYKKTSSYNMVNYLIPSLRCVHLGAQSTGKRRYDYKFFVHSYKSQTYYINHYSGTNVLGRMLYQISLNLVYLSKYCTTALKKLMPSNG